MAHIAMRASSGFIAGALATLTFQQAAWELLHVLIIPGMALPAAWPTDPLIPFDVPRIANLCFWGGVYGVPLGLVLPLSRFPSWFAGLLFGVLVVAPGLLIPSAFHHYQIGGGWFSLRTYGSLTTIMLTWGLPVREGIGAPLTWLRAFVIDGAWGTGAGMILSMVLPFASRGAPAHR